MWECPPLPRKIKFHRSLSCPIRIPFSCTGSDQGGYLDRRQVVEYWWIEFTPCRASFMSTKFLWLQGIKLCTYGSKLKNEANSTRKQLQNKKNYWDCHNKDFGLCSYWPYPRNDLLTMSLLWMTCPLHWKTQPTSEEATIRTLCVIE